MARASPQVATPASPAGATQAPERLGGGHGPPRQLLLPHHASLVLCQVTGSTHLSVVILRLCCSRLCVRCRRAHVLPHRDAEPPAAHNRAPSTSTRRCLFQPSIHRLFQNPDHQCTSRASPTALLSAPAPAISHCQRGSTCCLARTCARALPPAHPQRVDLSALSPFIPPLVQHCCGSLCCQPPSFKVVNSAVSDISDRSPADPSITVMGDPESPALCCHSFLHPALLPMCYASCTGLPSNQIGCCTVVNHSAQKRTTPLVTSSLTASPCACQDQLHAASWHPAMLHCRIARSTYHIKRVPCAPSCVCAKS